MFGVAESEHRWFGLKPTDLGALVSEIVQAAQTGLVLSPAPAQNPYFHFRRCAGALDSQQIVASGDFVG